MVPHRWPQFRNFFIINGCRSSNKRTCCWNCNGINKEGEDFSVLSDILGDEDHLGDMDFKVAGTKMELLHTNGY